MKEVIVFHIYLYSFSSYSPIAWGAIISLWTNQFILISQNWKLIVVYTGKIIMPGEKHWGLPGDWDPGTAGATRAGAHFLAYSPLLVAALEFYKKERE